MYKGSWDERMRIRGVRGGEGPWNMDVEELGEVACSHWGGASSRESSVEVDGARILDGSADLYEKWSPK